MMNEELIVKPRLDVVFKMLFVEHTDLLVDFLSYALDMPKEKISDIYITNPNMFPNEYGEKFAQLDLVLTQTDGTKINIEIQNKDEGNYKERSIFNCSKMYTKDVNSGDNYSSIPKTICINILGFTLFEESGCVCIVFPTIRETNEIVSDKWEIIYFQTKKIPQGANGGLWDWLKFFTISTEKEREVMEKTMTSGVRKASVILKQMNADDKLKELARIREKAALTEGMVKFAARKEGITEVARTMLSMNLPFDLISKSTGLSENEIKSLTINEKPSSVSENANF
jgi:predicted transposase/invertase (TIGR01784 family)